MRAWWKEENPCQNPRMRHPTKAWGPRGWQGGVVALTSEKGPALAMRALLGWLIKRKPWGAGRRSISRYSLVTAATVGSFSWPCRPQHLTSVLVQSSDCSKGNNPLLAPIPTNFPDL